MTRILHFSDVHFPLTLRKMSLREMLHPKRQLAALNYLLRRKSHFCDADTKWAAFGDFIESSSFDAIICTGDLTAMGMRKELQHAHRQLQRLLAQPNFILLPGNHDVYLPGKAASTFYNTFPAPPKRADILYSQTKARFPFVQLIDDATAILAINSAKPNPMIWRSSGRIPDAQLKAAKELLQHEALRNRHVLVATHYNVDNHDSLLHGMENRSEVRETFNHTAAIALIHGHIHRRRYERMEGFSVPVFCAGSLTYSHREAFWVYEFGEECSATPGFWDGQHYELDEENGISFNKG